MTQKISSAIYIKRLVSTTTQKSLPSHLFGILIACALGTVTVTRNITTNTLILICSLGLIAFLIRPRRMFADLKAVPRWLTAAFLAPAASIALTMMLQPIIGEDSAKDALSLSTISFAFAAIGLLISSKLSEKYFWIGLWICILLSSLSAAFQLLEHGLFYRAGGARGKPILFANIALATGFMIAAARPVHQLGRWSTLLSALALTLGIFCAAAAQTRGALVFVPLGALLLLLLEHQNEWRETIALLLIVVLLIAIVGIFGALDDQLATRMTIGWKEALEYLINSAEVGATSSGTRLELWKASLLAVREYPLTGVGLGQFDDWLYHLASIGEIRLDLVINYADKVHTHAHNTFFHVLATQGIAGLVSLALPLTACAIYFIKALPHCRNLAGAGLMLIAGYCVFGLTEAVFHHRLTANFFLLTIFAIIALVAQKRIEQKKNENCLH